MVFKKYPDIERLGHPDNLEIFEHLDDTIVIEEKVDGGNGCFWLEKDELHISSRNRDLTSENDANTFKNERIVLLDILKGKKISPEYYYYIEWMALHTIHYTNAPAVIGLDIRQKRSMEDDECGLFLGRENREQEFTRLEIENVPLIWRDTVGNLKKLDINSFISKSKYYGGKAEGIVIKNYCRKSRMGNHQLYAKVVTSEFKEENKAVFGNIKQEQSDTSKIVDRFATDARIKKIILKQVNEFNRPLDLALMKYVPTELVLDILREEIVTVYGDYRNIDFKEMRNKVMKKCLGAINELMIIKATVVLTEKSGG